MICPAGSYCAAGVSAPTPCPAGVFGNVTGLSTASCSGPCLCCSAAGASSPATCSATQTVSATQTLSFGASPSGTPTPSVTETASLTMTATQTTSTTNTPSNTGTQASSPTQTLSQAATPTRSPSPSPSASFGTLSPGLYSGSGSARDPCVHSLAYLFAFGPAAGDAVAPPGDDQSYTLTWAGPPLRFYGANYTTLYANQNGIVSFGASYTAYASVAFPTSSTTIPFAAIYWVDVCTTATISAIAGYATLPNNVFYRVSTAPSAADRARFASYVATNLPAEPVFAPVIVSVVTWFAVGYYSAGSEGVDMLDTFQMALGADASGRTFAVYWLAPSQSHAHCAAANASTHLSSAPVTLQLRQPPLGYCFDGDVCDCRI